MAKQRRERNLQNQKPIVQPQEPKANEREAAERLVEEQQRALEEQRAQQEQQRALEEQRAQQEQQRALEEQRAQQEQQRALEEQRAQQEQQRALEEQRAQQEQQRALEQQRAQQEQQRALEQQRAQQEQQRALEQQRAQQSKTNTKATKKSAKGQDEHQAQLHAETERRRARAEKKEAAVPQTVVKKQRRQDATGSHKSSRPSVSGIFASTAKQEEKGQSEAKQLTRTENSTLSEAQLAAIQEQINALTGEINSWWPYPNKDVKAIKVAALEKLVKYANQAISLNDTVTRIKDEFPRATEGSISTRTNDLLEQLAENVNLEEEKSFCGIC
ncbi:hypothetical protein BN59_00092 [Legionella massiliensis]|uniref:Uncharacterized protein n=1 Tax=Legionella massiliensis TaxID=1034943 RepID=A0A078KVV0_9GAMM|nr:hypothetical protein [Legionella massiliensis]CDZ75833.1 hypothetical protein BN59_00092 [Legionella massiliensis]CEE11571.1 hypothetical protein BN1094_00092 [Legionella massiliensis]